MDEKRPDPDALLAQVKADETKAKRGKLKVFFGAAAGVGKTFAMLSDGRTRYAEGTDVVVGYAEPHARPETEALLLGMEILPYNFVEYRAARLKEFDLDAALKRKPELILVDELAHTNAPGLRHAKRWQDVEELIQAGIDVCTTLNVQHLESLNDVVAQITGIVVRETLPDDIFEKADEIELIDLPPDDLIERLEEGKVYIPAQAEQATRSFFRKSNLTALRELALRKTADRVNAQVQSARQEQFARQTWPTAERILVCITDSRSSTRLIRTAKRMAVALHAEWIVAHVETPRLQGMSNDARDRLLQNFHLAERLGAETVTLSGSNVAEEIVNYARSRNVSKIVVGKPDRPRWREVLLGSIVDDLIRASGEIDVEVIRGGAVGPEKRAFLPRRREQPFDWRPYAHAVLTVATCSGVAGLIHFAWPWFDLSNLVMVYLVGVVIVAARFGRGPSAFAAVLAVAAFDFFFVPPRLTFAVADTQYLLTFVVMLGVALLIATLTVRIREQAEASRQRERRTEALYRIAGQLASTVGRANLIKVAIENLEQVFAAKVEVMLKKGVQPQDGLPTLNPPRGGAEEGVIQWVMEHQQIAGSGTDTLPASDALYVPLIASRGPVGVLSIHSASPGRLLSPEQWQLLEAFANQIALAIERDELAEEARQSQVHAEAEKLRSSLLSAVSHDLRTPLAVITGASGSLLEGKSRDATAHKEMLQTINDEAERLGRLVTNLLDITRLESGVKINRQWQPLEEIVGSALHRLDRQLGKHPLTTSIPADLPLVLVDGVLVEQLLVNLLDNAVRYTPPGTPIEVTATAQDKQVVVSVADAGPGLAPGEETSVFEKFQRGSTSGAKRGSGLGLAICRAIVQAHGGRIWAENKPASGGGAVFYFTLPLEGEPPVIEPDTSAAQPATPA